MKKRWPKAIRRMRKGRIDRRRPGTRVDSDDEHAQPSGFILGGENVIDCSQPKSFQNLLRGLVAIQGRGTTGSEFHAFYLSSQVCRRSLPACNWLHAPKVQAN